MKNKNDIIKSIFYTFIVIFFMCSLLIIDNNIKSSMKDREYIELNDGWDVYYNGEIKENIKLDTYEFENANKGSEITIKTELPYKYIVHPALVFKLYHCVIDVYIDDECIYRYGHDLASKNKSVGSGYFVIELPEDFQVRVLTIKIRPEENGAVTFLQGFKIENETTYMASKMRKGFLEFLAGVFQVTLGIIVIILFIFIGQFSKGYRKLLWIGGISMSSGMWILSYYDMTEVFIENRTIVTCMEHLGLYCVVPAICMFFSESIKVKMAKRATFILAVYGIVFVIVLSILESLNVAHLATYLSMFHIYAGVFCVVTLSLIFLGYKEKSKSEKIICLGTMLLILGGAVALMTYNLFKFVDGDYGLNMNILPIMTMLFIMIMMISYIEYLKEMVEDYIDKKLLFEMAYKDLLTGLSNRGRCDKALKELDEKKSNDFAVVCFDLNNLKVINDTKGHLKGDSYISRFASILEDSFGEYGIVGRMGGDEFVVIIDKFVNRNIDIEEKLSKMISIAKLNKDDKNREFPISFAYGYSIVNKNDNLSAGEAYELADKRMYECKEKQKAGRK